MNYDLENLDGWAIPREAFEWIYNNLPHGSTILELGSGNGTKELVKYYNVISIEQNADWLNYVPRSNYIYAPLKDYQLSDGNTVRWYDDSLFEKLPVHYDLLLIDGPIGVDRFNITYFIDRFKQNIPYAIDDTNREIDKNLAITLSNKLNKKIIDIKGWEKEMMILTTEPAGSSYNNSLDITLNMKPESEECVNEHTRQWASKYMCKWELSEEDTLNDIIYAIQNNTPISYTRYGDGEILMLKEYFRKIHNNSYYINLCNANRYIPHVKEFHSKADNIEDYARRYHYNNMYDNFMYNRWDVRDDATQTGIIKTLGESLIYGLQNSSHIGIWQPELDHIGDYFLRNHAYTPHIELFKACGVNFKKLTGSYFHLNEPIANPFEFKKILNGKPIHIFTSNEEELKNVVKLHNILETSITYTNLKPIKRKWETHSFAQHKYIKEKSKEIKEHVILYGLGYGAKHVPGYLHNTYGKAVIDIGAVLDGWSAKITRPHFKTKSYILPNGVDQIESYPWDINKETY